MGDNPKLQNLTPRQAGNMGADDDTNQNSHEYLLEIPQEVWTEFSGNVPKSMTYSEKITELIRDYNQRQSSNSNDTEH